MDTKVCKACGNELPINRFKKRIKNGYRYTFGTCQICIDKKYYHDNRDKCLARAKAEYRKKHPIVYRVKGVIDIEKKKARQKRYNKRHSLTLSNSYVANALRRIGVYNHTPNVIELKRKQIKLYRACKQ